MPLSEFAAAISDFLVGTPGGEVREEVIATGAIMYREGKKGER